MSVITKPFESKDLPPPKGGGGISTLQISHYRNASTGPLISAEHTLTTTCLNHILNKAEIHVKSSIICIIHCYISVFHPTLSSAFSVMWNEAEETVHCSGRSTTIGLTGRREMVAPPFVLCYKCGQQI